MMSWIPLSFLSSFSDSFQNLFLKKQTAYLDSLSISWYLFLMQSIVLLPFAFIWATNPSNIFWIVLTVRTLVDILATFLYVESIKQIDISLSIPLVSFTPIFIVLFEFFLTKDAPSFLGLLGIIFIVAGVYFLFSERGNRTPYSILKGFLSRKSSFYMLIVSLLWGVTSTLHKIAITNSNPFFYAGVASLCFFIGFTIIIFLYKGRTGFAFVSPKTLMLNAPAGLFGGLAFLFQALAQGMMLASYVNAIKRTSILFSSILGSIVLKEPYKGRVYPILVTLLGVIILIVFG